MNFWFTIKKPILALAPMAGYTDSAFRLICRQIGSDVVYSEMISTDAIVFKNKKTIRMLKYSSKECPLIFQLFGNKPERFKEAVIFLNKKLKNKKNIGIDINFGCPAHKVTKTGSGAALMNELDTAYKIINAVCKNTDLPVSIKVRTKVKNTTCLEFAETVKNLPISAMMIHGRSLKQGFSGNIDFATIKKVKQILPDKIVLANGGVDSLETALKTLSATCCDGLGLARGVLGNPWLFASIRQNKKNNPPPDEIKKMIICHAELFLQDNENLINLRKHFVRYIHKQKNASALRQRLVNVENLNELKKILKDL